MEYFSAALFAISLVSIASLFAPTQERLRRAVLSALSILLLFMLIPKEEIDLSDLFSIQEEPSTPEASEEYTAAWREGVESGIERDLSERFSLSPDGVTASCQLAFGEESVEIRSLSLRLSGKNATADATGILLYLEKSYGVYASIHLEK